MFHVPAERFTAPVPTASFPALLERRFAAAVPARKSQRTRERLRVATARALEARGYHRLRVADIAAAADTSSAAFYVYFANKTVAALEVLEPFLALMVQPEDAWTHEAEPDGALRLVFGRMLALGRENPGLLRAVDELRDEDPAWARRIDVHVRWWHRRLAQALLRRYPPADGACDGGAHIADLLASLSDGLVRRARRRLRRQGARRASGCALRPLAAQPLSGPSRRHRRLSEIMDSAAKAAMTGAMTPPAAFKPFFLGPHSENEAWLRDEISRLLDSWFGSRRAQFAGDPAAISAAEQAAPAFAAARRRIDEGLAELAQALRGEVPTYAPRFLGHMVSDVSLPALLGHLIALLHNPNNTSREASKVGTAIESEAIAMLARMIGFDGDAARGHFTSGGTVANLEAVWRARFRLDSRLALAVAMAERDGQPLDVFAAAHRPAAEAERLVHAYGLSDAAMRARSSVLGNPFEAAERLGRLSGRPYRGPVILAPGHKHYSWVKAANLFGLGEEAFWSVGLDREGRLCPRALAARIAEARAAGRPVLLVVTVAGTTELGELDPIDAVADHLQMLQARDGLEIWHHVDAAYGGFFCALDPADPHLGARQRRALAAVRRADTVTIDPHKLGYVPYACGALLARDGAHDAVSSFAAPYVDRPELGDAPWMRTLEGSRAATGAAATWLAGRTIGFGPDGIGAVLGATLESCRAIRAALCAAHADIRPLDPTDTNIFCFSVARSGEALSAANARTSALQAHIARSPHFAVSRTVLSAQACPELIAAHVASYGGRMDTDRLVLARCVAMNPFWADAAMRARLLPEFVAEICGYVGAPDSPPLKAPAPSSP